MNLATVDRYLQLVYQSASLQYILPVGTIEKFALNVLYIFLSSFNILFYQKNAYIYIYVSFLWNKY